MIEFFDTSSVPDDRAHWDALAARIAAAATHRDGRVTALASFAESRVSWTAAALAVAAGALLIVRTSAAPADRSIVREWTYAVAPADELARTFIGSDRPPRVDELILGRDAGKAK